jgi:hypothetical protein
MYMLLKGLVYFHLLAVDFCIVDGKMLFCHYFGSYWLCVTIFAVERMCIRFGK